MLNEQSELNNQILTYITKKRFESCDSAYDDYAPYNKTNPVVRFRDGVEILIEEETGLEHLLTVRKKGLDVTIEFPRPKILKEIKYQGPLIGRLQIYAFQHPDDDIITYKTDLKEIKQIIDEIIIQ